MGRKTDEKLLQWTEAKTLWTAGMGLKEIEAQTGLKASTVGTRASREKWKLETKAAKAIVLHESAEMVSKIVERDRPQEIAYAIFEKAREWIAGHIDANLVLREELIGKFKGVRKHAVKDADGNPTTIDLPFLNTAQDFKAASDAMCQIDAEIMAMFGLDKVKDETTTDASDIPTITLHPPEGRTL